MNPYRRLAERTEPRAPLAHEELVLVVAILALGLVGIVVGLVWGRATEAGLGVGATIFGVHAARALLRQRRR